MPNSNEYMARYMANRRTERRTKLIFLAGSVCVRCGKDGEEFNHLDRHGKLFSLSGAGLDKSWQRILKELEKCELLCQACHKQYTNEQWKTQEIRPWNDLTSAPYVCGTMRSYQETKCRCSLCKLAKRQYRDKKLDYHSPVTQ